MRGGLTWTPSTAQPPRACRLAARFRAKLSATRKQETGSSGVGGEGTVRGADPDPSNGLWGECPELPIRSFELGRPARVAWSWNPRLAPKPRRASPVTGAWPLFQSESRLLGPVRPRGFPRKSLKGSGCWPREPLFSPGSHPLKKRCLPSTDCFLWLPFCSSCGVSTSTLPCEMQITVIMLTIITHWYRWRQQGALVGFPLYMSARHGIQKDSMRARILRLSKGLPIPLMLYSRTSLGGFPTLPPVSC